MDAIDTQQSRMLPLIPQRTAITGEDGLDVQAEKKHEVVSTL